MATHLTFDVSWAAWNKVQQEHAQFVMQKLGITYQHATPQTMGDCWWFWNCENVPDPLPPYLSILNLDPMTAIGYGLSKEDAEKIRDYSSEKK